MGGTLLFGLHLAAVGAAALALCLPGARRRAARALGGLGLAALLAAAAERDAPRTLAVEQSYPAFEGQAMVSRAFPIETTAAPGFVWGLVAAAFCFGWAAFVELRLVRRGGDRDPGVHPFWAPLALGWTGLATVLLLEKVAAPAALVRPLAFERCLLPAALAAAILLALRCKSVLLSLSWLALFITLCRLPIALFGTLATRRHWGTSLDVHSVTLFANPLVQRPVEVESASSEQLGWLIWAPQLLVLPSLYMMSVGGVAFAVSMFVLHPKGPHLFTTRRP